MEQVSPVLDVAARQTMPGSALVWIEGSSTASPASSLMVGQRVLCFDRLATNVCYGGISNVQVVDNLYSNADEGWVLITLEDGSQLEAVSYHVMWPCFNNNFCACEVAQSTRDDDLPVLAADLRPSLHTLMVIRTTPLLVVSISEVARVEHAEILIVLRDQDRYQILVTPGLGAPSALVAVGARYNSKLQSSTDEGDCLTAQMFVWTEDTVSPQPVGSLRPGHLLLCYDRLADNVTHVPVLALQTAKARHSQDWVEIKFEDGTKQELPSSCLVTPLCQSIQSDTQKNMLDPIAAGSLSSEVHRLQVFKIGPVPVKSVTQSKGCHRKVEVSLTLEQPGRYDVFLRLGLQRDAWVAVGCTSIQGEHDSGSPSGSFSGQSSASWVSRATSSDSSQSDDSLPAEVIIAGVTANRFGSRIAAPGGRKTRTVFSSHISARTVNALRRHNLQSLGSMPHASGTCNMCIFQARYATGRLGHPCKYGILCDRCHAAHPRQDSNTF